MGVDVRDKMKFMDFFLPIIIKPSKRLPIQNHLQKYLKNLCKKFWCLYCDL